MIDILIKEGQDLVQQCKPKQYPTKASFFRNATENVSYETRYVIEIEKCDLWIKKTLKYLETTDKNKSSFEEFKNYFNSSSLFYKEALLKGINTLLVFKDTLTDNSYIPIDEKSTKIMDTSKVFIVHGHDEQMKLEVSSFLLKLGIEAIILHEQANGGKTIIEKIENNTNVGFGIVLYSPCDEGKKKGDSDLKDRARQNVVFEHGYLIGKLGRDKVCALNKSEVEVPSDINGIVYIPFKDHWKIDIAKELRTAGYNIDMNVI